MIKIKIKASILAANLAKLGEEIKMLSALNVDALHIDVMDGLFVPNFSFGPDIIKSVRPFTKLPIETHLMISSPFKYIETFTSVGSNEIILHLESRANIPKSAKKIHALNNKFGLCIKPSTNADKILPYLKYIDKLLIMTVEPGFCGQKFMHEQLAKISRINDLKKNNNLNFEIEVDGGINIETAKLAKAVGADSCVIGSALFENSDMISVINEIKQY